MFGNLQAMGGAHYQVASQCRLHHHAGQGCARLRAWTLTSEPTSQVERVLAKRLILDKDCPTYHLAPKLTPGLENLMPLVLNLDPFQLDSRDTFATSWKPHI